MDYSPPSLPFTISNEEFCLFHRIDSQLYWILVINLYRDPTQSMQVLALWIWLERNGYGHLVKKIISLPSILINEVADETTSFLKYINTTRFSYFSYSLPFPSEGCDISLLQSIVEKEISVPFFYDKPDLALQGVADIMHNVCARAFYDIMERAISSDTIAKMMEEQKKLEKQSVGPPPVSQQQHPLWYSSITPYFLPNSGNMVRGGFDHQMQVQNLKQENNRQQVLEDERTLFLTFSKGHPVKELEVREFFTRAFGDSMESLYMHKAQPNEQALFARIVFRNTSMIDMIVNGSSKAKLSINGKHVWVRKFVPKVQGLCCQN